MSTFSNTDTYTPENESDGKLFSEACERNKEPILAGLRTALADAQSVLEIGSGTGQHAVYFSKHLPHLTWQTSDMPVNHASIHAWIAEAKLSNVKPPLALNIDDAPWSSQALGLHETESTEAYVDAIYTSNTLHIINWQQVIKFFAGIGPLLTERGKLCVYGPFKYDGKFSGEGDASFDAMLRERNEGSAIRDIEAINQLAAEQKLKLVDDTLMPANNHLLMWQKT